ncbi:MAG TPA: LD-carboxypeptidase [Puia sp.]|nr:LD-carboxypeptidase [Puia sp.]
MKRKKFLTAVVATGAAWPLWGAISTAEDGEMKGTQVPPYLKPGDIIGITCPAGNITGEEIRPAVEQIESWGFNLKVGDTVGKKDFTFGGTDEERRADFQRMLDDPSVRAILCARGGYGAVRIIDGLNFSRFAARPSWIIGFSDITVIHCHINRHYNIASIHSKMCNSFPDDLSTAEPVQVDSILSIRKALTGEHMSYSFPPDPFNRKGIAEAPLVGGNLKTIETLAGTRSDLRTAGKILFVEDTGEYLYSIDRMFWNLKRTGKLEGLKGLIVGGFKIKPDDPGEEFGKTLYDIVMEKVKDYRFPVCFNFPVGHQKENYALKEGMWHRLDIKTDACSLAEIHPRKAHKGTSSST